MNQISHTGSGVALSAADREHIRKLSDVIAPATDNFPSASDASVHTKWIDRGIAARPDLLTPLLTVARLCAEEPADQVVTRLSQSDSDTIEPVIELLVACYYMSPKVRKRLNYKGQVANPILPGEAEHYLRDDLLAQVAQRPPFWRNTPDAPPMNPVDNDKGNL